MGREIERKFLVVSDAYRQGAEPVRFRQGYLSTDPGRTVRVRVAGHKAFLTVKGPAVGFSREEYEYEIPLSDADSMLDRLCSRPLIDKHRFKVPFGGFLWEVDEFHAENEGLVVAEIELPSVDAFFPIPPWAGKEVTSDHRYANSSLVRVPFSRWGSELP